MIVASLHRPLSSEIVKRIHTSNIVCVHWLGDICFVMNAYSKGIWHRSWYACIVYCFFLHWQMISANVWRNQQRYAFIKCGVWVFDRGHWSCQTHIRHSMCSYGEWHLPVESATTKAWKHHPWCVCIGRETSVMACDNRLMPDDIGKASTHLTWSVRIG